MLYEDKLRPDPDRLTSKCLSGEYDSVVGDRTKCSGTYREFIVFDQDQANSPDSLIFLLILFSLLLILFILLSILGPGRALHSTGTRLHSARCLQVLSCVRCYRSI